MRTIILRFSDAELETSSKGTVKSHIEIISSSASHSTWWGWWKKEHEPYRGDLLRYVDNFGKAQGLRIGLVNRKGNERLYSAKCIACATSNGEPIGSPEPALTPSYYAEARFPAWFKLMNIVEMNRADFVRQFGDVPGLDPTLYEVIEDDNKIRVVPSKTWNLTPINSPGDAILHISDMHFGECTDFL